MLNLFYICEYLPISKGQASIRNLFETLFQTTTDYPQVSTNTLLWKSERALFSNSPLHLFIPSPRYSFFLICVRVIEKKKRRRRRKEKQRGWIWAEKHPLGLFPFLKELLQISCLIYEGGLRRDTLWHDRQSPSLSRKRGLDRTMGDVPGSIGGPGGCHRLVNSWGRDQPFHLNQSVVN